MNRRRTPRSASAEDLLNTLQDLTARARREVEFHQARVELAQALQRDMLPAALPAVPGLQSAARYAPARHGLDIGGDWYDGFPLADGALGFAIGDVQGHDVEAAAFMGQVRIAMRAIAGTASDPGEILGRTNDLLVSVDSGLFATCTFMRLDPATWELHSARAGHVACVWATTEGRSGVTEDPGGLPLGIEPGEGYPVTRRTLDSDGAIVLLTDGVVEGPSLRIEDGLERVRGLVAAHAGSSAGRLADEVLGAAEVTGHEDDAAVLVLRHAAAHRGPR
ncbi:MULTISPECIES: PP2C family protein-serine/threonine phosphatase [Streptomyces]|uniref:PPM-type phosphatase domain-containing protein n=1 Tax=Streptomyces griseus subsp. griseus (strain JCM 4626 / CBS 651.72 / NBRC 13350 / KCC S-0626 / ISP 5235) TaxID=455632 RepID=B1VQ38_STRGG|nr:MULTISPECIES: PP2C family protein-serine/threonine phosphatase [Streptomyces]MYR47890.1 SpoIIE family protein phosphatase [Streptomyces sp. SID4928]EGE39806.1 protein serine/threonine phosphatase [Streptomyces sp. ACT-1]MBW3702765.1 serine/threonine-protein phosphatase [Streptomyces griseus]SED80196.1 Stage II sporulation protein E (SpoIIE) [Streptomyces griseus]SQA21077.1 Protein serine/threonine phosphatase [Streptomyces griseus]